MASIITGLLQLCVTLFCKSDDQKQDQQQNQNGSYPGQNQQHQQQPHPHPQPHKPHGEYPPPQQQQPSRPSHKPQHRIDENQQNQHDPKYLELRAHAKREGDQMAQCFDQSHRAYESGDGAKAKELSNQGKHHKSEMERLNAQARDWIYYQNNTDSAQDEVDLHGLFVAEAIEKTEQAIQTAQSQGKDHLNIIVGKGLHSPQHVAKLKPAIEDLMRKYELAAHIDPHNEGVLIVSLGGSARGERGLNPDDITHKLDRDDENCVVM